MSRNHEKLRVFLLADGLVLDIYRETRAFPVEERFGLQAQIRRAAVSVPANIVEGSARRSTRDYLHFVNIALASTCETRYLVDLAWRLQFIPEATAKALVARYSVVVKSLVSLSHSLESAT